MVHVDWQASHLDLCAPLGRGGSSSKATIANKKGWAPWTSSSDRGPVDNPRWMTNLWVRPLRIMSPRGVFGFWTEKGKSLGFTARESRDRAKRPRQKAISIGGANASVERLNPSFVCLFVSAHAFLMERRGCNHSPSTAVCSLPY